MGQLPPRIPRIDYSRPVQIPSDVILRGAGKIIWSCPPCAYCGTNPEPDARRCQSCGAPL